jgi:hypothetical protein
MDFHKTLQPITAFENMQVLVAPIVKDKLLTLYIWLIYVLLKKLKTYMVWLKKPKIYIPWKFDLESILHQTPPMVTIED